MRAATPVLLLVPLTACAASRTEQAADPPVAVVPDLPQAHRGSEPPSRLQILRESMQMTGGSYILPEQWVAEQPGLQAFFGAGPVCGVHEVLDAQGNGLVHGYVVLHETTPVTAVRAHVQQVASARGMALADVGAPSDGASSPCGHRSTCATKDGIAVGVETSSVEIKVTVPQDQRASEAQIRAFVTATAVPGVGDLLDLERPLRWASYELFRDETLSFAGPGELTAAEQTRLAQLGFEPGVERPARVWSKQVEGWRIRVISGSELSNGGFWVRATRRGRIPPKCRTEHVESDEHDDRSPGLEDFGK